jgi:rSAM/selenodomain-associated transferase 2
LITLPYFYQKVKVKFMHLDNSKQVRNISVVIPTLNESINIRSALDSIKQETGLLEMVVTDGGSSDETIKIAEHHGAIIVDAELGRGNQIATGIRQCKGDVIMILHADCRVQPGTFQRILAHLNSRKDIIGGALGMQYQEKSVKILYIELLNYIRARWLGIAFGDQGQFFRREALPLIGGFPEQMLMEDIELSLRMKKIGSVCYLPKGIIVSNRRWLKHGFSSNFFTVIWLCVIYLYKRKKGIDMNDGRTFYEKYYKNR